jgi:hypothetical protein
VIGLWLAFAGQRDAAGVLFDLEKEALALVKRE